MKRLFLLPSAILLSATAAMAAGAKSYQVTGPVVAMDDQTITVQKGGEKWQIARDGGAKLPADVTVGSKVTVSYTMTAVEVEDRSAPLSEAKVEQEPSEKHDTSKEARKPDAKEAAKIAPAAGKPSSKKAAH